jgi:hypothetical protein
MERPYTAIVLVDHRFLPLTRRFLVDRTPNDLIHDVMKKVKAEMSNDLSTFNISDLTVWKTMGEMVIDKSTSERLAEILSCINRFNVNDGNTIQRLSHDRKLADLGLSDSQTLLIQCPGTSRIPTIVCRALLQV